MKTPKPAKSLEPSRGFDLSKISNILGLIFILIGILLVLVLLNFDLPIDLSGFETILEFGAAIGSILGGLAMLFKKHESVAEVKP
jgi:uncharacterized membrane protein